MIEKENTKVIVKFCKLHDDAVIPQFASSQAAGFDFHALESCVLKANSHALIRTGLCMEIEDTGGGMDEAEAERIQDRMRNASLKTAVKDIAGKYGLNKNEVYQTALELKNEL